MQAQHVTSKFAHTEVQYHQKLAHKVTGTAHLCTTNNWIVYIYAAGEIEILRADAGGTVIEPVRTVPRTSDTRAQLTSVLSK